MKYKYVVFCPYFGKLPNNIDLWLKSCSYNEEFKFIVFTNDNRKIKVPQNVLIENISFEKFREKVQKKFDFTISLDTPYKLCDYKTAYGYIFEEYIGDAKYWGACDMDLVFGNLAKFVPNDDYDKISTRGHLMLLKNTKELREAFMIKNTSKICYKDILSSPIHFASDEIGNYGINNILLSNGYKIYHYENTVADILPTKIGINLNRNEIDNTNKKLIFSFEDGKVYLIKLDNKNIDKIEFSYVHFQKRTMNNRVSNDKINKFIITYNSFENYEIITKEYIINHQPKKLINKKWFLLKFRAIKIRYKRIKEMRKIIKGV